MGNVSMEGRRGNVARLVVWLVALAVAGCSSNTPTPSCTPGAQLACACPGGASSVQVCGANGILGFCACPDGGAVDVVAMDALALDVVTLDAPEVTDAGLADGPLSLPDGCASTTAGNCCGVACPAVANGSPACLGGACGVGSCAPGFGDCNRLAVDGCEVELATTTAHCGACGAACSSDRTCVGSSCVACPGLRTTCAGACIDPQTNPAHCGGCNAPCATRPNAVATCVAGGCGSTCTAGFADCDGIAANGCESTASDATNCGTCGNVCPAGEQCIDRRCGCTAGRADCDGSLANGCEVNTTMGDITHCGACGIRCPTPPTGATAVCSGGMCRIGTVVCTAGRANCDGSDANGCEVVTLSDVNNCGAGGAGMGCGNRCPSTGGTPACLGGVCTLACNAGLGNCDINASNGCETNTNSSVAHCGACGHGCPSRPNAVAGCAAGACRIICNAGRGNCDGNDTNGCEIDLNSDINNCTACGMACRFCSAGVCVP